MKIKLLEKDIKNDKSDIEIIIVNSIEDLEDKKILENLGFEAKDETVVLLAELKKIYVGCEENDYGSVAISIATAIKKFNSTKFKSAKIELKNLNLKALVEGTLLGSYTFNNYKSEKKKDKKQELNICVDKITEDLEKICTNSIEISRAVNKTRDMVNTPPADFYPKTMAKIALDCFGWFRMPCLCKDIETSV